MLPKAQFRQRRTDSENTKVKQSEGKVKLSVGGIEPLSDRALVELSYRAIGSLEGRKDKATTERIPTSSKVLP